MNLDKSDQPELQLESGFISFFKKLSQPSGKHLKLFERSNGDYYSVHGDDALFIADSFYNTSTVLKYYDGSVPSCSLSQLNALAVMKDLLLVQGYRVEIWKCENKDWKLAKQASPGNLKDVEEMLFSNSEIASAPVVMAVKVETVDGQKMVGVSLTDATTSRIITISEFIDNDAFSNLESLLVQQSIKECIIADDSQNMDLNKVKQVLEKCEVVCTLGPKSMFNTKNIAQDLNRLVESELDIQTWPEYEMKIAMSATAAIISYLSLLDDESNLNAYTLSNHNLSQYMKLDSAAVKALNLTPAPNEGNKNMNLYGLLNRCQTSQGSRLLLQWIKQPLMNIEDIKKRQDFVEALVNDSSLRQDLHSDILKKFPDLHRLGKKFQRGKALLQDVLRVYQVVLVLPSLIEALKSYEGDFSKLINEGFIKKFSEYAASLENLKNMVETTVDLRAADNHEYLIKADFHDGLKELKGRMDAVFAQLEPEARKVANRLGVEMDKKLKFENNSQFGYHLRLSRTVNCVLMKDAAKIRGIKEYIELRTVKAGVQFTTVALRRLSEDYHDLQKEYGIMQSSIAKEVITVTGSYFPILENLNRLIAELDVFVSFAHIAIHAPVQYTRPQLEVEGNLIMKAARHPCVEVQDDVSFIENDVEMIRNESMFHIITGPNMGGKSTFIRQIGVICLMAQIGCFVPCEEATISITDSILARVGAGDSQLKCISTFMAEMLETASILRSATSKSLIIIDELGRGTSTKDGYGLAKAIAEYIATELECFTLFATHFHEITELESKIMTVTNYHVQAHLSEENNQKLLTLLYKVKKGPCDQSFGIHVAELAQFPISCIKMAKRKAVELEGFETTTKKIKSDTIGSKIILDLINEIKNLKKEELDRVPEIVKKYDLSNEYIQSILVEL